MTRREVEIIAASPVPPTHYYGGRDADLPCWGCYLPLVGITINPPGRGGNIRRWVHNETCLALVALRAGME